MQKNRLSNRAISLFFLLMAVVLLVISSWPFPRSQSTQQFPMAFSLDHPELSPVELEREIFISIPSKLRVGEADEIRFEFSSLKNYGSNPSQESDIEKTGESYLLEARLEMPGLLVNPADSVIQPVIEGHNLRYTWEIQTGKEGIYTGTLWVYLLVMPEGSTEPDRRPVLALPVKVEGVNTPIFNAKVLRVLGGLCIAAAFLSVIMRLFQKWGGGKA